MRMRGGKRIARRLRAWGRLWVLLLGSVTMTKLAKGEYLILADGGASDYQIVLPRAASPSQKHAAAELQRFLRQMSGAELPVVSEEEPAQKREVLLGNARAEQLDILVDWPKLGAEGYMLRTQGERLLIAGSPKRGTLYGVYGLLEDHLGCRWFTAQVSHVPKVKRLVLPRLDETVVPRLEYREPFWTEAFDGDWAARNRMNSANARLTSKHGGKTVYEGFVHTLDALVPRALYEQHPEYFPLRNGRRVNGLVQRCLTHPDVVRIATENVLPRLRKNPRANIVSVSQNDVYENCECPACKELDEAEGTPAASLLSFVNQIAEAVEKEFPHVAVDTLAYQYTRKPPRTIRPRPNVIVRLCSIECCFAHPLDGCSEASNTSFLEDLRGWSKLTRRLYVWDYTTNFKHYLLPFPNLDVLDKNIRTFVAHGVVGIFEQGNYSQGGGGELSELRAWVHAKLLWNPDRDGDALIREFVHGVYGRAAPAVQRFLDGQRQAARAGGEHVRIFDGAHRRYLDPALLRAYDALLEEAEQQAAASGDPALQTRVQRLRLPIWYARVVQWRDSHQTLLPALRRLLETSRALGYTHFTEWTPVEQDYKRLGHLLRHPPPPLASGVIVGEEPHFWLHQEGELVTLEDDERALNGGAARMVGRSQNWNCMWGFPPLSEAAGKRFLLRARVRVEKKGNEGFAFHVGAYDEANRQSLGEIHVRLAEIAEGDYHWYEIGKVELKENRYAYVAPNDNAENVAAIFVDRFELIPVE